MYPYSLHFACLGENDVPPLRSRVGLEKTSLGQLRTDPRASPSGLSGAALGMSFPDPPSSGGGEYPMPFKGIGEFSFSFSTGSQHLCRFNAKMEYTPNVQLQCSARMRSTLI